MGILWMSAVVASRAKGDTPEAHLESALAVDDVCGEGRADTGAACSLQALQLKAAQQQRVAAEVEESDIIGAAVKPTFPCGNDTITDESKQGCCGGRIYHYSHELCCGERHPGETIYRPAKEDPGAASTRSSRSHSRRRRRQSRRRRRSE